jgi:hypothetical protein
MPKSNDWIALASYGLETLEFEEIQSLVWQNAISTAERICNLLHDAVETCDKPFQDNATVPPAEAVRPT